MKTLLLLRHAKSSWKNPELQDIDRPLNKRGRRDAPKMGKWLKENVEIPDLILSSPSVRTLATIHKVGLTFGLNGKGCHEDPRIYHASPSSLLEIIHSTSPDINSLLLVGHNPGLTELANQLCPLHAVSNIPTCGIYGIKLHCHKWKDAQKSVAEFLFFQFPKNLNY